MIRLAGQLSSWCRTPLRRGKRDECQLTTYRTHTHGGEKKLQYIRKAKSARMRIEPSAGGSWAAFKFIGKTKHSSVYKKPLDVFPQTYTFLILGNSLLVCYFLINRVWLFIYLFYCYFCFYFVNICGPQ